MSRPQRSRILGMALALIVGVAAPGVGAGTRAVAPRADARKLVRIAATACSGAVRELEAPGRRDAKTQPLHATLTRMGSSIAEVGARLEARDLGFFKALRAGTRTLAELRVVLPRSGVQDPEIEREIRTLAATYGRLRNRYGKEWLRFRTGKPVDEEERKRFAHVQAAQALFVGTLAPLLDRARAAGDARTAGELTHLISQAESVAQAPATLDEILNASVVTDTIEGEYAATREANPVDKPEWKDADQVVEQLHTDASVGFVFATDMDAASVQGWSWVQEETTLPEEAGDVLGEALAVAPVSVRTEAAAGAEDEEMPLPEDEMLWIAEGEGTEEGEVEEAAETPAEEPAKTADTEVCTPESAATEGSCAPPLLIAAPPPASPAPPQAQAPTPASPPLRGFLL
jgi:hypothetical protein